MTLRHLDIAIVGGSMSGLTLALGCAHRGVPVRVIERSVRRVHGGDNLSVSLSAIAATVGCDPRKEPKLPVVPAYRDRHLTTWPSLYRWLRDRAGEAEGITFEENRSVASVSVLNDKAQLTFSDGATTSADIVIGADGYHSTVRRALAPELPLATYSGYLVWRGLIEESALSQPVDWPNNGGLYIELVQGFRLVAAVLPGRDGSLEIGRRQVTFAWFDARRDELLRRTHCVTEDGHMVGTLQPEAIDPGMRDELAALVPRLWPATWIEAVTLGIRAPEVMRGAPIAEYRPDKLARGPLAIMGDAAHCLSPMTGSGYASGVEDAVYLATILSARSDGDVVEELLLRYERARLPYIRALVEYSTRMSAGFVQYANRFYE